MKESQIRKAVISDAAGLGECMVAAYSAYQERMNGLTLPPLEVDYVEEISENPTWVVERDGNIIGGLIMTFSTDTAQLANIAVHPLAQGSGLGRELLEFAEQKAQEKGYTQLRLATHVLLSENVSLYQYLGWKVIDRDSLRVTMEKRLS